MALTDNGKLYPDKTTSTRASFVLRCWVNSQGELRARIIDVGTGVNYPMHNLAELPSLIEKLVQPLTTASDIPCSTHVDQKREQQKE